MPRSLLPTAAPTLLASIALTLAAGLAQGQVTLSGFATADNAFDASLSLTATDAGTPYFSGTNWQVTSSGVIEITTPGSYYLQVRAQDFGRPEMFLARFTLSGPGAAFANGTQTLVTNTTDWTVSTAGFGLATTAPADLGANGTGPWGLFSSMPDARFIWSPTYDQGLAYFTAQFTVIPAPAPLAMGGLLIGAMGLKRRR